MSGIESESLSPEFRTAKTRAAAASRKNNPIMKGLLLLLFLCSLVLKAWFWLPEDWLVFIGSEVCEKELSGSVFFTGNTCAPQLSQNLASSSRTAPQYLQYISYRLPVDLNLVIIQNGHVTICDVVIFCYRHFPLACFSGCKPLASYGICPVSVNDCSQPWFEGSFQLDIFDRWGTVICQWTLRKSKAVLGINFHVGDFQFPGICTGSAVIIFQVIFQIVLIALITGSQTFLSAVRNITFVVVTKIGSRGLSVSASTWPALSWKQYKDDQEENSGCTCPNVNPSAASANNLVYRSPEGWNWRTGLLCLRAVSNLFTTSGTDGCCVFYLRTAVFTKSHNNPLSFCRIQEWMACKSIAAPIAVRIIPRVTSIDARPSATATIPW